jgi:hypothetical protein
MLATIHQNRKRICRAAGCSAARLAGAQTVAGYPQTPVTRSITVCFNRHLSLLCYPLPKVDRMHFMRLRTVICDVSRHPRQTVETRMSARGWFARRFISDIIRCDGPPRMVARSTWSGRERSSHSRFPPVPRVGLVTFAFFGRLFCHLGSSSLRFAFLRGRF